MPFLVIKGTFHIVGYSPDGDSVRFRADNKEHWAKLSGPSVQLKYPRGPYGTPSACPRQAAGPRSSGAGVVMTPA
jgi:hypothetical protein